MGPLHGVRVVEFAGLGPGPMACMLLADLGANIVRLERPDAPGAEAPGFSDPVMRGRDAIPVDLKHSDGVATALALIAHADALVEGFRPGVMESLGLSPSACQDLNPRLVYARMTGWGQTGPMAPMAGHDINYIGLSGALDRIGRDGQPPTIPLNLVGDYGGGALYLALGVVSGILEARRSGRGQVLDVAMIDGSTSLLAKQFGLMAAGQVQTGRAQNLLDGGAPFYDVYACADGRFVAVGAIEAKFFAALLRGLSISPSSIPAQNDRSGWPEIRRAFAQRFLSKTRDEWAAAFAATDACVTPVLAMDEVAGHPHIQARGTMLSLGGVVQPAAAPRFLDRPAPPPSPAGRTTLASVLQAWGTQT